MQYELSRNNAFDKNCIIRNNFSIFVGENKRTDIEPKSHARRRNTAGVALFVLFH